MHGLGIQARAPREKVSRYEVQDILSLFMVRNFHFKTNNVGNTWYLSNLRKRISDMLLFYMFDFSEVCLGWLFQLLFWFLQLILLLFNPFSLVFQASLVCLVIALPQLSAFWEVCSLCCFSFSRYHSFLMAFCIWAEAETCLGFNQNWNYVTDPVSPFWPKNFTLFLWRKKVFLLYKCECCFCSNWLGHV